jgi:arginyl-tRNA synthetase
MSTIHHTAAAVLQRVAKELGWSLPAKLPIADPPPHITADCAIVWPLTLAPELRQSPRDIATTLVEVLQQQPEIAQAEVAGNGFVNIILTDTIFEQTLAEVIGESSGASRAVTSTPYSGQKFSVEYVSANPTGPMHFGNARGGPFGEALCRLFEALGASVRREFYVNDYGGQAGRFMNSVVAAIAERHPQLLAGDPQQYPMPEDGYRGEYVYDIAATLAARHEHDGVVDSAQLGREGLEIIIEGMQAVCSRFGITFDHWQRQSDLTATAALVEEKLRAAGTAIEKDGALWLSAGITEGDRESVLRKTDGLRTYFLDDLAYHYLKLTDYKADVGMVVLGSDHSGHGPRMKSGVAAMGFSPDQYEPIFYGRVEFYENGEKRKMSKRSGSFVTLEDMLDELPREVLVYFLVSKAPESAIDFDITLAKDTSERNPIYAIQYAHARACSVLGKIVEGDEHAIPEGQGYVFDEQDRSLLLQLDGFQAAVLQSGLERRPHVLAHYVHELAIRFHRWYAGHRILDAADPAAIATRIAITRATKATIAASLRLLGIEPLDRLERATEETADL